MNLLSRPPRPSGRGEHILGRTPGNTFLSREQTWARARVRGRNDHEAGPGRRCPGCVGLLGSRGRRPPRTAVWKQRIPPTVRRSTSRCPRSRCGSASRSTGGSARSWSRGPTGLPIAGQLSVTDNCRHPARQAAAFREVHHGLAGRVRRRAPDPGQFRLHRGDPRRPAAAPSAQAHPRRPPTSAPAHRQRKRARGLLRLGLAVVGRR